MAEEMSKGERANLRIAARVAFYQKVRDTVTPGSYKGVSKAMVKRIRIPTGGFSSSAVKAPPLVPRRNIGPAAPAGRFRLDDDGPYVERGSKKPAFYNKGGLL